MPYGLTGSWEPRAPKPGPFTLSRWTPILSAKRGLWFTVRIAQRSVIRQLSTACDGALPALPT